MEGIGWLTLANSCCRPYGNSAVAVSVAEGAPSLLNPLGGKSVGGDGINGIGAAIGVPNAVARIRATPQPIEALLPARAAAQCDRSAAEK
jgi:hypothetical protein